MFIAGVLTVIVVDLGIYTIVQKQDGVPPHTNTGDCFKENT